MAWTRRQVLAGAAATAGALAMGGLPLAAWLVDEDAVILAAVDALFPPGDGFPTGAEVDAAANARTYLAKLPAQTRLEARGLLRLIELGAAARAGGRFTRLSREERQSYLTNLGQAGFVGDRLMAHSIKQICAVAYWQHPRTWDALGYDGPLVGRRAP